MSSPLPPSGHDERLWPGPLGWTMVLAVGVVAGVSAIPVRAGAALGVGLVALGLAVAAVLATSPRVAVRDGELRAGDAHIPVRHLGTGRTLDRAGVRAALGPGSDARTFALVRAWLPGAVELEVIDPADPTPTWLVSTRRPSALLAAVRAEQERSGQAAHSEQIG